MASFVPYQIDHAIKNVSKNLGFSKKRVLFKFGIASPEALSAGATGPAARGSEHDVVFTWSLSSGKRSLMVDGREVHRSETGLNGWTSDRAWQFVFEIRSNLGPIRVLFISQPSTAETRPFEIRVGGSSYFQFNQIFELGTPKMRVRNLSDGSAYRRTVSYDEAHMSSEERRMLAKAKIESLKDLATQEEARRAKQQQESTQANVLQRNEDLLLNFDEPAPAPAAVSTQGYPSHFASSITMDSSFNIPTYGQPPPQSGAPAPYGYPPKQQPGAPAAYGYPPQQQPGAPAPYGYPPQQQAPAPAPYGYPSQHAQAPPTVYEESAALTPYQPPAGQAAPSPYAMPGYGYQGQAAPPHPLQSPSAQSIGSYGSAPSFARPPAQQQQPGYPPQQQPAYPPQQQPSGYPPQQPAYPPQQQPGYPPSSGYPGAGY